MPLRSMRKFWSVIKENISSMEGSTVKKTPLFIKTFAGFYKSAIKLRILGAQKSWF